MGNLLAGAGMLEAQAPGWGSPQGRALVFQSMLVLPEPPIDMRPCGLDIDALRGGPLGATTTVRSPSCTRGSSREPQAGDRISSHGPAQRLAHARAHRERAAQNPAAGGGKALAAGAQQRTLVTASEYLAYEMSPTPLSFPSVPVSDAT